jgi:hypothetical protein
VPSSLEIFFQFSRTVYLVFFYQLLCIFLRFFSLLLFLQCQIYYFPLIFLHVFFFGVWHASDSSSYLLTRKAARLLVRSPGFEPGFSTWQADVLNHSSLKSLGTSTPNDTQMARLRPQAETQSVIEQLKAIAPEIEQKIAYTLIKLKSSSGIKDETVKRIGYALTRLAQETDLNNPIAIGEYIRDMKHPKTEKPMDNATKNKYANAHKKYCARATFYW